MTLVICPDCGQEVSNAADACPHCARPLCAGGFEAPDGVAGPLGNSGTHDPEPAWEEGSGGGYEASVHPWLRYLARMVDTIVAGVAAGVFFMVFDPSYLHEPGNQVGFTLVGLLIWIPLEASFLSSFSTTPGKALLRIRVVDGAGDRPGFFEALGRAVRVWFFGLATGFPLIALFTMAHQYDTLKKHSVVSWDRNLGTKVLHAPISGMRVAFGIILLAGIMSLNVL